MSARNVSVNTSLISAPDIQWKGLKSKTIRYLTDLIDTYGTSILHTSDDIGFYPIHWAVLSGKHEMVDLMIRAGVSPRLKARNSSEPEPIHVAAIEGHLQVIDVLLTHGVNIDVKDGCGCTPLMRAAMYGYNMRIKCSETILHLVVNGADLQQIDGNGWTCLHYAINGHNDEAVHLLLTLGLNPNQFTGNGCRAIHFARQSGSEYLMRLLGPLTEDLTEQELESMVAQNKRSRSYDMMAQMLTLLARVVVLFAIFSAIMWAYPQYIIYYLPNSNRYVLNVALIAANIGAWISWYSVCTVDPGYLPKDTEQYRRVIDKKLELGTQSRAIGVNGREPDPYRDQRLCHTCRTLQVMRSTHCRWCERCTAGFDHHCIYLSTCIGLNNRIAFFALNLCLLLAGLLGALVVYWVSVADGNDSLYTGYHWFNFCYCIQFSLIGLIMSSCNVRRAAINLTQNEEVKAWHCRYGHMRGTDGRFNNPYCRGSYYHNIIDYFTKKSFYYTKVNSHEFHV